MKKKYLFAAALGAVAGVVTYRLGKKSREGREDSFRLRPGVPENDPESVLGCDQEYNVDKNKKVRVLITGSGSYIGESFKSYAEQHYPNIECSVLDMKDPGWRNHPFKYTTESGEQRAYDCVFHVAGIAHSEISTPSEGDIERYYRINTDLAVETAKRAKECGVRQFIFMSSMIIYGSCEQVTRSTIPRPANFYGDSKWQADRGVRALDSRISTSDGENSSTGKRGHRGSGEQEFNVAVLRPPMIYGRNSRGNYPSLSKIAKVTPVFPKVSNTRSMLYIENLCEFVSQLMLSGSGGVFMPQNREYSDTGSLVQMIGTVSGKHVRLSKVLSSAVVVAKHVPIGKIRNLAGKAFGSSWYVQELSKYRGLDYQVVGLEESIRRTEV